MKHDLYFLFLESFLCWGEGAKGAKTSSNFCIYEDKIQLKVKETV
jgi:hypothetical protein